MTEPEGQIHDERRTHRLTARQIEALTVGADDQTAVNVLLSAECSRRLHLVSAVLRSLSALESKNWPLGPIGEVRRLLERAEKEDPVEFASIIHHPYVGKWAYFMLRRTRSVTSGGQPDWVDVGYVYALAAAAAVRTGLDFHIHVPSIDGSVVLPTLGRMVMPAGGSASRVASVSGGGGRFRIRLGGTEREFALAGLADQAGWEGTSALVAEAGGHVLRVSLDNIDPYRMGEDPAAPADSDPGDAGRWQSMFQDAWELLIEADAGHARTLASALSAVTMLPGPALPVPRSITSGEAFGGFAMSAPSDAAQTAATLAHEFAHLKLFSLARFVPFHQSPSPLLFYAPWRDDPRPAEGLLHGIYAFFAVARFWRAARNSRVEHIARVAHFEFALWRTGVLRSAVALKKSPALTRHGVLLLDRIHATAMRWQQEPVFPRQQAAATALAMDHRCGWRLRHLQPSEGAVAALAHAWTSGLDPPHSNERSTLKPGCVSSSPATRAMVARLRLNDPASFDALAGDPRADQLLPPATQPADLCYVRGDLLHARAMYVDSITSDPADHDAWSGLRLTLEDTLSPAECAARSALSSAPELVRAVARSVTGHTGRCPDPVELARWIGVYRKRAGATGAVRVRANDPPEMNLGQQSDT